MAVNKQQSAIKEARDQLFLDTADDVRLNVVTSNLGLDRPLIGLDDDTWRAAAKAIALQYKQIPNVFHRLLEVILGPQTARIGCLSIASQVGETIIQLEDASDLVQIGTLILSPGTATQETVAYCFRDIETNKVFLNAPLAYAHDVIAEADSYLRSAVIVGAVALPMVDTSTFPISGFPYQVILDRGLATEEVVDISANDTGTNTLTCGATVYAHAGPTVQFLRKPLDAAAAIGRTFLKFDDDDTRNFPASGWLRIAFGAVNEETHQYNENDVTEHVLWLEKPLVSAHVAGESVELVSVGAAVETLSVVQDGVAWGVYDTEPDKVKIYIPSSLAELRIADASWFHNEVPPAAATTLASAAVAEDTELEVASVTGFPDEAALISIDGGTLDRLYTYRDEDAGPPPTLTLPYALGQGFLSGAAVDLIREVYAGTDLEEGNLRDAGGVVQQNQFPGPYLYDETQRAPSLVRTTLATAIPPPTRLAAATVAGRMCVEVESALEWPPEPFAPFNVRLGRGTGDAEDREIIGRNLAAATTVNTLSNPGDTSLDCVATNDFPEANGVNPAGYRVGIGTGLGYEEALVDQNNPTTDVLTFLAPLTKAHAATEPVVMLNDVLTFDPLTEAHTGPSWSPTVQGALVEAITTQLELAAGTGILFPDDGGTVWLNFGREQHDIRTRITNVVSPTLLEFATTSQFPTTGYPYLITVGQGLPQQEYAWVTNNDTTLNQLTLASALVGTFVAKDYVEFYAGSPVTAAYFDRDTDTLDLSSATIFETGHRVGENLIYSPSESVPSIYGTDYAFLMPPNPAATLEILIEFVRAAGVEVLFLADR
jgi:hypothetical protein